jgi:hypothetical protein
MVQVNIGVKRRLVAYHDGDAGITLGVGADALQFGDDVKHPDDDSKVAGHRCLGGDEQYAFLLYLKAPGVDFFVVVYYLLRQRRVAVLERLHGARQRLGYHATHSQHIVLYFP